MTAEYKHVTSDEKVQAYEAGSGIFKGLLKEVKELSKKKPDATMSSGKVKLINRVLKDLLQILRGEPEGKYLDELDEEALPQVSDAVLGMVQFDVALQKFHARYRQYDPSSREHIWITSELTSKSKGPSRGR